MFCKLHGNDPNKHPDLTPHIGRGEEEVRYTDQEYEDDTSEGEEGETDLMKVPFLPGQSAIDTQSHLAAW